MILKTVDILYFWKAITYVFRQNWLCLDLFEFWKKSIPEIIMSYDQRCSVATVKEMPMNVIKR